MMLAMQFHPYFILILTVTLVVLVQAETSRTVNQADARVVEFHNRRNIIFSTPPTPHALSRNLYIRCGATKSSPRAVVATSTREQKNQSTELAIASSSPSAPTGKPKRQFFRKNYVDQEKGTNNGLTAVSDRVDDVRAAARRWKRKEFWALLVARITFVLVLPLSAGFFVLSVSISFFLLALRILTLNLCLRETSRIVQSASKALLATIFASITGIFLPVFALFGLIAAVAEALCEMAEPILRIRYNRQLAKLRHLQKILTDPVLMETMEYLIRGAEAVSAATARQVGQAGTGAYRHVGRTSRWAIASGKKRYQEVQDNSVQLIETLLESPEVQNMKERIERKMPERLSSWTQDQWESLRKSGVLEDAARAAIHALRKELTTAATFLPYLEAIKDVREKQLQQDAKQQQQKQQQQLQSS